MPATKTPARSPRLARRGRPRQLAREPRLRGAAPTTSRREAARLAARRGPRHTAVPWCARPPSPSWTLGGSRCRAVPCGAPARALDRSRRAEPPPASTRAAAGAGGRRCWRPRRRSASRPSQADLPGAPARAAGAEGRRCRGARTLPSCRRAAPSDYGLSCPDTAHCILGSADLVLGVCITSSSGHALLSYTAKHIKGHACGVGFDVMTAWRPTLILCEAPSGLTIGVNR